MPRWSIEGVDTTTSGTAQGPPRSVAEPPARRRADTSGRYWDRGRYSAGVIGMYVVFLVIVAVVLYPAFGTSNQWIPILILGLIAFFLVRYLTTIYLIDETYLRAWRILGGQKKPLDQIRAIEYASLRDLSPTGFTGTWGWRGRMWSPTIGRFDVIHTEPQGILVTGGEIPLFISPHDAPAFARELSRRVRSYSGRLRVDVGDPQGPMTVEED